MDTSIIIKAALVLGGAGLVLGAILAIASQIFHVEVDPKIEHIREVLPGANCGACGYPGCDGLAEAIAKGEASPLACVAGGAEVANQIATVLGIEVKEEKISKKAIVRCGGGKNEVVHRYIYDGKLDCQMAQQIANGPSLCVYGCLGFGSCMAACSFGAITMGENGLPYINWEKCRGCGACVEACPRKIIALVPENQEVHVFCRSHDKGKIVRSICKKGCIGCKACEKVCESDAVHVVDNLAVIDYEKCINCQKCVEKCPTGCIATLLEAHALS
ncbi:RnfABCDGE type electron transport complex subunit B [Candidatus Oleimmundimicrobium sp.]|uniref:RnfABCDGE type electron transport complex subunit B n=1 Tax=Candidatus Oleimmundimicrobium sp. TaxID=3060597 RepID=UPI0027225A4C|nr:RnfABCDGE type electron transport complex subunit B [Candidatus Oleimmundimicrobium sp.]MDO8886134.1 RnfABCDGE type electron transport complex subunit B [Candidatus Oleimmundimicrobium sp.]